MVSCALNRETLSNDAQSVEQFENSEFVPLHPPIIIPHPIEILE